MDSEGERFGFEAHTGWIRPRATAVELKIDWLDSAKGRMLGSEIVDRWIRPRASGWALGLGPGATLITKVELRWGW